MKDQLAIFLALFLLHPPHSNSQSTPHEDGYRLVWSDEFNTDGTPDPTNCDYEQGFVRNNEQQWYQKENATCKM
ncbi:MAG TPA: hypothetical protein VHC48_17260, partial [Puia sp.]|nr:hypothetical protein [Puia sp.]